MRRIPITLTALALILAAGSTVARAQCGLTGSPVINGAPANLCGTGGTSYMWEGPNGFTATTQCVALTAPGEYALYAFDADLGRWFGPCLIDVTGDSVSVPPPPPPPPAPVDTALNCPRAAWYWTQACRRVAGPNPTLSPQQIASIAAGVDQRAQSLGWADAQSGFCATMRMPREGDLRNRAIRQFASVLANLSASELGIVTADGRAVHLRDNTILSVDAARGMPLREWISATDAELASLASAAPTDRAARKAFQRIRRIGWMINHGMGVGEVCKPAGQAGSGPRDDDESMAMALGSDEDMSGIVMEAASPNPFRDQTRIAFSLTRADQVELSVVDLSGRTIRTLARGEHSAGRHELSWDGRSDAGQTMPVGAYFVHGRVGGERVQGRLVMVH